MSHLTIESKAHIEQADCVLYLVNEPAMQLWIAENSKNSESLDKLYIKNSLRNDNYSAIAEYIIEKLKTTKVLCIVIYGHPTVFVQPSLLAANMATNLGYTVSILPGISAEDCLFADLRIDPGTCGCQSFEATDFILYRRKFDSGSHLILWQPYVIGLLGIPPQNHNPKNGLQLLANYLSTKYDPSHEITLYEAAQYSVFNPKIETITLNSLQDAALSRLTTLYIKPAEQRQPDLSMINAINAATC